jgi:pyruvate,orthophosphate dikinase
VAEAVYAIGPDAKPPAGGAAEVGNKAWNLIRMAAAGMPVPPGFVLSTGWCRRMRAPDADADAALAEALAGGIVGLEAATGLGFGSRRRPLVVSVRSGAAASMPGMLATVLDVGLTGQTVNGLIRLTGNPRLAWDSYRRLIGLYAEVVQDLPRGCFDAAERDVLAAAGAATIDDLDHRFLRRLAEAMLDAYAERAGEAFPQDPAEQLRRAARAVFRSWDATRAVDYRRLNGLDDDAGTAVTVQAMVYGNAGGRSGSGVGFSRDPASGARGLYLEFRFNGQGEDVVGGRHAPAEAARLARRLPAVWQRLETVAADLERLFADAQDFEFTLQAGVLHLLQTRAAKRTPWAALRIAVDMVEEGLIDPGTALARLAGIDLAAVARARLAEPPPPPLATAVVASLGVAGGAIALDAAAADRLAAAGGGVILVRRETSTDDVAAFARADGLLTAAGGRTAHAAVVARQLGKVCLVGCPALAIDLARRCCRIGEREFAEGAPITLDGDAGAIYPGRLAVAIERPERELAAIAAWQAARG